MNRWSEQMQECVHAFDQVAQLAGVVMEPGVISVECLPAPHVSRALPRGKMAVYGFWGDGEWLKIGIAGNKSGARFTSQHYKIGRARSSLALSLSQDARMAAVPEFAADDPGTWIRNHCHRVNLLLPETYGRPLLALLEAFLHVRLNPRHER